MAKKNISSKAYHIYSKLGNLKFPKLPEDYFCYRTLRKWTKFQNGNIYQGEIDELGHADGRGIWLLQGQGLFVGHNKKGNAHGERLGIEPDGRLWHGCFIEGNQDGKFIWTYPDGKSRAEIWENGTFKNFEIIFDKPYVKND